MLEVINAILPYISPTALPLVVVILGGIFIYKKIDGQRKQTKEQRDSEYIKLHDTIEKLKWEVDSLKQNDIHREQVIEDIRSQLGILNTEVAKLSVSIDKLTQFLTKE